MNLIIYINDNFEDERALFDLDTKEVLIKGDYDNDKIDSQIEGYLHSLGISDVDDEWIDETHEHFKMIGFYE